MGMLVYQRVDDVIFIILHLVYIRCASVVHPFYAMFDTISPTPGLAHNFNAGFAAALGKPRM